MVQTFLPAAVLAGGLISPFTIGKSLLTSPVATLGSLGLGSIIGGLGGKGVDALSKKVTKKDFPSLVSSYLYPESKSIGNLFNPGYLLGNIEGIKGLNNIFRVNPRTFTRGIGGTSGLKNAFKIGYITGNPNSTLASANKYRVWYNEYQQLQKRSGIKLPPFNKVNNFSLSEREFNLLKKTIAPLIPPQIPGKIQLPSREYRLYRNGYLDKSYAEYKGVLDGNVQKVLEGLNKPLTAKEKITIPEVNTHDTPIPYGLTEHRGRQFFPDQVDKHNTPLSYWWTRGENATMLRPNHYANSTYGVRLNNPLEYYPYVHPSHYHYSLYENPSVKSSDVEFFRRVPFTKNEAIILPKWYIKARYGK